VFPGQRENRVAAAAAQQNSSLYPGLAPRANIIPPQRG